MFLDERSLDRAGITAPELRRSYDFCRRLLIEHDGMEYWLGSYLLPARKRPHLWAIYGLLRHVDQLADSGDPQARRARIDEWSSQFLHDLDAGCSADPVTLAMLHTIRRYDLELENVVTYLHAQRMVLRTTDYETFGELWYHLDELDGSIARLWLPIFAPPTPRLRRTFEDLAIAAQLTNILRDLAEDLREGRLYLPLDELERFGVTRAQLELGELTPSIRELLRYQVNRARQLWARGTPGLRLFPLPCRVPLRLCMAYYAEYLNEIERRGYDVLRAKPHVAIHHKATALLRGLLGDRKRKEVIPTITQDHSIPMQTTVSRRL